MADVNNCLGKRKTLCSQIIFELEGDDDHLFNSPNSENTEPASKMTKKEDITEPSDSNLYQELSQNSVETNISVMEKLTELQEENLKLKKQLEEINNKLCKCQSNLTASEGDESDGKHETLITIKFYDKAVVEEYGSKFKKFLKSYTDFTCTENDFTITVERKKRIDLTSSEINVLKKRKRKKSKSKSQDLFVLDTSPSISKTENNLKYESKYLVTAQTENLEKNNQKFVSLTLCFNCDQNHSLRDCPEPKNYMKINAARNKLKQQQITKARYHMDEEQKFSHLKPGKISVDLKQALGICSDELPSYIYKMRKCGYPPGWMEDARNMHSNISLFDMDGKELTSKINKTVIDPDKVIEYPGFNMPMDKGIKDNYKKHDCPPYSEKCSKSVMLEFVNKVMLKEQDNLETCDMDLDQSGDENTIPSGCVSASKSTPKCNDQNRSSPSLVDLETKKLELLAELCGNNTNGSNNDEKVNVVANSSNEKIQTDSVTKINLNDSISLKDSFIVIDDSEEVVSCNGESDVIDLEEVTTPTTESVKKSMFGTPVVKGASPYSKLPDPIKFSKDISPVINFENLPNATGKYKQMNTILQKIRKTLKNCNDKL